jgi:processive 1,2-diacylglycerol beta-glucosyltransferase
MNILILTGDLGDGHKQAANALMETCVIRGSDVKAEVVDFMEWSYPVLHTMVKYLFVQGVEKFPSVYGYLFHKTRRNDTVSIPLRTFVQLGLSRLVKMLEEIQPSVVVSTFPLAAAAMSFLKRKGVIHVPTVTVITDHTDHSLWIHPLTDHYVVGSEFVRSALMCHGVAPSSISATGIPIRQSFSRSYDLEQLKRKHGLAPDRPVVLAMGGGCGMMGSGFKKLLQSREWSSRMQLIVVCGRNERLREQLQGMTSDLPPSSIQIHGYVEHIHELMAGADLLITKPGGLTTSEALSMHLPMLLYKPLPGQEFDNAKFLVRSGAAVLAKDDAALQVRLQELLEAPSRLNTMRKKAAQYKGKQAAWQALDIIVKQAISNHAGFTRSWA